MKKEITLTFADWEIMRIRDSLFAVRESLFEKDISDNLQKELEMIQLKIEKEWGKTR